MIDRTLNYGRHVLEAIFAFQRRVQECSGYRRGVRSRSGDRSAEVNPQAKLFAIECFLPNVERFKGKENHRPQPQYRA